MALDLAPSVFFMTPTMFRPSGPGAFRFARVPLWVLARRDLSDGAKLLFGKLLQNAGDNDSAWPSQAHLAEALGTSQRTISARMAELKKAGLVHVTQRRSGSAVYRFPVDPWPDEELEDARSATAGAQQLRVSATQEPALPGTQDRAGCDQPEPANGRDHCQEINLEQMQVEETTSTATGLELNRVEAGSSSLAIQNLTNSIESTGVFQDYLRYLNNPGLPTPLGSGKLAIEEIQSALLLAGHPEPEDYSEQKRFDRLAFEILQQRLSARDIAEVAFNASLN